MHYATSYDVGERKRPDGINEDSVAVAIFEEGHREGYRGPPRPSNGETGSRSGAGPEPGAGTDDPAANRSVAAFALADGAGGHEAGDVASYIASTVVCERLAGTAIRTARSDPAAFDVEVPDSPAVPTEDDLQAAIGEAVVAAHRRILEAAAESGTAAYTTVVAGIAARGSLHLGWVGDSRAYLVNRDRGSIVRLTKDHTVVEQLRGAGDIKDAEAAVHPRGNEITRALGGAGTGDPEAATVEVDTRTVELYAEDVVVVTSDGLPDAQTDAPALYDAYVESDRSEEVAAEIRERVVTDDEIRDVVLDGDSLAGIAGRLVEVANERGGKDNVSVLLLRDPALASTPEAADLTRRDVDTEDPIEDRETVVHTGE